MSDFKTEYQNEPHEQNKTEACRVCHKRVSVNAWITHKHMCDSCYDEHLIDLEESCLNSNAPNQ